MPTILIRWPDTDDVAYDVPLSAIKPLTALVLDVRCCITIGADVDPDVPRGDLGKDLALYALGIDLTLPPGLVVVLCGASGSGKTTVQELVKRRLGSKAYRAVSYTTRAPRPGETDGVDYHFVDRATFATMVANDRFVEHAEFNGNCYGSTPPVVPYGKAVIQVVETAGCDSYRKLGIPTIFVALTASDEDLRRRIEARDCSAAEKQERFCDVEQFVEYMAHSAWTLQLDTSHDTPEMSADRVVKAIEGHMPQ